MRYVYSVLLMSVMWAEAMAHVSEIVVKGTDSPSYTISLTEEEQQLPYCDKTYGRMACVLRGSSAECRVQGEGLGAELKLYIDFDQDSVFTVEEEVALPSFLISDTIPDAVYRARLQQDGDTIDFALNICGRNQKLELNSLHGSIYAKDGSALPVEMPALTVLSVKPTAVGTGYERSAVTIRHGHGLDGPQYIKGIRQWGEYTVKSKLLEVVTVQRDSVDGDVRISCEYSPTDDAEWVLDFSDEFNGKDGSQPSAVKWRRSEQKSSAWNRYCSDSKEVVYVQDGKLVCRCIPNTKGSQPMISGAIESRGLYTFQYGKVECRAKANPWVGNFPAIWMMPQDNSAGWPNAGEIDIFETIDNQNTAYGTVHSRWTYVLGNTGNPKSSSNTKCQMDRYHTYGLEWDETTIKWFVDGKQYFKYEKSSDESVLSDGQWPYDAKFYLILNQSVGMGTWAQNPDTEHTYEFLIDWVRVYKKAEASDEILGVGNVGNAENAGNCFDLSGRSISAEAMKSVHNTILIVNGRKVFVR